MTQTDYIKALLEWYKLVLTSTVGAVFLLLLYQVQYPEKNTCVLGIGYFFFLLIFIGTTIFYVKKAKQLVSAEK